MMGPQVGHGKIVSNWFGAKNRAEAAEILTHLTGQNRVLELFGGGGKVTLYGLARERWWNDSDPALHRLAVAIRDDPLTLLATCASLDPVKEWDGRGDDRAAWPPEVVAVGASLTFGARMEGRAHTLRNQMGQWKWWCRRVPEVSQLLRGVRLTCLDWEAALADADGWGVYADPPYENAANKYVGCIDHRALRSALGARTEKTVLSGYYAALPGWRRVVALGKKPSRITRERMGERFGVEAMWVR